MPNPFVIATEVVNRLHPRFMFDTLFVYEDDVLSTLPRWSMMQFVTCHLHRSIMDHFRNTSNIAIISITQYGVFSMFLVLVPTYRASTGVISRPLSNKPPLWTFADHVV